MASTKYYLHKKSGYFAGRGEFDGRGVGFFDLEFYNDSGDNNPNIQLNFSLKSDFKIITAPDIYQCHIFRGQGRTGRYEWDQECLTKLSIVKQELENRVIIERPLYLEWLSTHVKPSNDVGNDNKNNGVALLGLAGVGIAAFVIGNK